MSGITACLQHVYIMAVSRMPVLACMFYTPACSIYPIAFCSQSIAQLACLCMRESQSIFGFSVSLVKIQIPQLHAWESQRKTWCALSSIPSIGCWAIYEQYSTKFSRDKIFAEINFTDEGFPLAMPI